MPVAIATLGLVLGRATSLQQLRKRTRHARHSPRVAQRNPRRTAGGREARLWRCPSRNALRGTWRRGVVCAGGQGEDPSRDKDLSRALSCVGPSLPCPGDPTDSAPTRAPLLSVCGRPSSVSVSVARSAPASPAECPPDIHHHAPKKGWKKSPILTSGSPRKHSDQAALHGNEHGFSPRPS